MILGQSAATAAVLAIDSELDVQDVSYEVLRQRLLHDKQVLDLPPQSKAKISLSSKKEEGVVVDDVNAMLTGDWTPSSSTTPYLDGRYLHDGNLDQGKKLAAFDAKLKPGSYEVRLYYSPHTNRATNVAVTVVSRDGRKTVLVNQRKPQKSPWASLGVFEFGATGKVVVSNEGADGYVIADGVAFVKR